MIALCLTAALLAAEPRQEPSITPAGKDGRIHLQLNGAAMFSVGGQMALGANLNLIASRAIWDAGKATGAFEFGTQLQYANEPTWLAPWIDSKQISGAGHRIDWVVLAGHGFYMGKRRRVYLGTHLYAGWNHWLSSYEVNYEAESVSGSAKVSRNHFVGGGQVSLGYRFSQRVGVHMLLGGPFPTSSSYAIGIAFAGLGLTVHLRSAQLDCSSAAIQTGIATPLSSHKRELNERSESSSSSPSSQFPSPTTSAASP
jgi:hypothetical protein